MSDPNPTEYGPYTKTHIPLHAKIALWIRDAAGRFTAASRASSPQIFANSGATSLTGLIPSSVVLDGSGGFFVANSSGAPEPALRIGTVVPAADDASVVVGNGTLSADLTWYGNIPTAYFSWTPARTSLNSAARSGRVGGTYSRPATNSSGLPASVASQGSTLTFRTLPKPSA